MAGSHYRHELIGANSRLDALQAVVLSAKLARLAAWTDARCSVAARYQAAFAAGPARVIDELPGSQGAYHLAVVRVPDRTRVQRQLAAMGIQTGIHYPVPCHRQPPYRRFADRRLPVAETTAEEILSLPIFPHMTDGQVARVCDAVREAVRGKGVRVA
jgi:dTDP-4-amino-4,6-dideoxygalactose transaminase